MLVGTRSTGDADAARVAQRAATLRVARAPALAGALAASVVVAAACGVPAAMPQAAHSPTQRETRVSFKRVLRAIGMRSVCTEATARAAPRRI